ncbi:MAG: biotin carboxylase N-terminal domain-containing protein [Microlunatus sp.]
MSLGFSRVLIANRGEIAVRVIRAARDEQLRSIAVYADPDVDELFVELADEAYPLGGRTAADSYLDIDKVLAAAARSGADAVHPGYGFLSENADFAQAVLDAGLTWIGPPPEAIRALGDKVTARQLAEGVGAPMAAGSADPVAGVDEVVQFARTYGLPVAIKAAFGGGGRGLKVARSLDEVPELFASATREAVAAFGRGECFVEQFLDRARHVEAQVLADQHGTVAVVGTRDCSLQRRFQKLVEEAPAPFLTAEQHRRIHESATAICRAAGYVGAATVEYLVQGPTVSFLEVNTRLQVEHPVTEETAGIDLVRQQFRIASGEPLAVSEFPAPRGHAIEFRINAEDPGLGFLPGPGRIERYREPSGPGVRVDSGVQAGSLVSGRFDSMLAKLIVTGATRAEALDRARRALAEFSIDGLATLLPFHRHIVEHPAFAGNGAADESGSGLGVHTRWLETEWANPLPPYSGDQAGEVVLEADGERLRVTVDLPPAETEPRVGSSVGRGSATPVVQAGPDEIVAPMHGTVVAVAEAGHSVTTGERVAVLEAMKMENVVTADRDGVIAEVAVTVGALVAPGDVLVRFG